MIKQYTEESRRLLDELKARNEDKKRLELQQSKIKLDIEAIQQQTIEIEESLKSGIEMKNKISELMNKSAIKLVRNTDQVGYKNKIY